MSENLPKGVDSETYNKAKSIIMSGFMADQDKDTIMSAIFSEGIPFSKINLIYKYCTVTEKLVLSSDELNEKLAALIKDQGITFDEDYAKVESYMVSYEEAIPGLQRMRVIKAIKKLFAENDQEFPRKVAPSRGRMGRVNKTLINTFAENKEASMKDLYQALIKVLGTEKAAEKYSKQFYTVGYALANGLTANKALTAVAEKNAAPKDDITGEPVDTPVDTPVVAPKTKTKTKTKTKGKGKVKG